MNTKYLETKFQILKKSKQNCYQNYFNENNTNLRKVWHGIKEIINIKAKNNASHVCVMENNDLVTDPTDVRNLFNKYYSSVAENILNKRNFIGDGNFMKYMPDPLPNSIFLENVEADEVEKLIKRFDKAFQYSS